VIKGIDIDIQADDRADVTAGTTPSSPAPDDHHRVRGEFVDLAGERWYAIRDVDKMPPFFISVVSNDDHWLFASSTGGLSAGRVSPATALFPYITVDKIHGARPTPAAARCCASTATPASISGSPSTANNSGDTASRNLYKNTWATSSASRRSTGSCAWRFATPG
jgi:hypothetical protein